MSFIVDGIFFLLGKCLTGSSFLLAGEESCRQKEKKVEANESSTIKHDQARLDGIPINKKQPIRQKAFDAIVKKLGSVKKACECFETFKNLNTIDMDLPIAVRRQANKLSHSDLYLSDLIFKHQLSQHVVRDFFGIGASRYDRVKKGEPLKCNGVISSATLEALDSFMAAKWGKHEKSAKSLRSYGLHALYLKNEWNHEDGILVDVPLIQCRSTFYLHAGRIVKKKNLRNRVNIAAVEFGGDGNAVSSIARPRRAFQEDENPVRGKKRSRIGSTAHRKIRGRQEEPNENKEYDVDVDEGEEFD
jgi:hypothetical protein